MLQASMLLRRGRPVMDCLVWNVERWDCSRAEAICSQNADFLDGGACCQPPVAGGTSLANHFNEAGSISPGLSDATVQCPAFARKRCSQAFHNQRRSILSQALLGQLLKMGGDTIGQFMWKDLALAAPLATTGIGSTLDVGIGTGDGQTPALFAGTESVSPFSLQ